MKTRKVLFINFFVLSIMGILFFGCKKDRLDSDTSSASDNALAEKIYNDVEDIANEAGNSTANTLNTFIMINDQYNLLGTYPTVTRDTISTPHRITIDFGSTNHLCKDGIDRRGKIFIDYTGHYRDLGMTRTLSFDSFFVNDNQIMGTKTVTNNGLNGNGNISFSISVTGTIILANNAGTINWTSSRIREWIEGENTLTRSDDVYLITGTTTGTRLNSKYAATITSPLRWEGGCQFHHPVKGTIVINITGKLTRTMDYGIGSCDREATVTINGETYNIILR